MPAFGRGKQLVQAGVDRAISVNMPLVESYISRAKRTRPDATPAEVAASLDRQFLAAVTTMGAAAGATAAVPGVTTIPALAVNITEIGGFLEASAVYILALAKVHGVEVDDLERRRTLVLGIMGGNAASSVIEKTAGRTGPYWAKAIIQATPMTTITRLNNVLGPSFITKYGTKQGILVLGRELPLGMGAAIGGAGNALVGRGTVAAAHRAFGPPPAAFPAPPDEQAGAPLTPDAPLLGIVGAGTTVPGAGGPPAARR